MVRSHTVMVWNDYLPKKSLLVVSGGEWWSRHNTRREGDIEFTTDPNFFEQIFNALTIVGTLEIDPRIYHEY